VAAPLCTLADWLCTTQEVRTVNGVSVRNLRHLKEIVESTGIFRTQEEAAADGDDGASEGGGDAWLEIVLEGSRLVVLSAEAAAATDQILEVYRVPDRCSLVTP
jgi:hypothetical protein